MERSMPLEVHFYSQFPQKQEACHTGQGHMGEAPGWWEAEAGAKGSVGLGLSHAARRKGEATEGERLRTG